jgi:hypothetical protein
MWLALAMSCSGSGDTDKEPAEKAGEAALAIVSPADGDTFEAGTDVALEVEGTVDGRAVEAKQVAWTVGDWTGTGASTSASGLPPGTYTVSVEASVDGTTLTDSVSIEVTRPEGDADTDTDADADLSYAGTLEADVYIESDNFDIDDHCSAALAFLVDGLGGLAGSATCNVFDTDIPFTIEGRAQDGVVTGNLVMTYDGEEGRTPFTGTGDPGTPMQATFDSTFTSSDGSLRIAGSWSAVPQ